MSLFVKLMCKLGIHEVPQHRHPATGMWLWGSSTWSRNPSPYCIREVDAYKTTNEEFTRFKHRKNPTTKDSKDV